MYKCVTNDGKEIQSFDLVELRAQAEVMQQLVEHVKKTDPAFFKMIEQNCQTLCGSLTVLALAFHKLNMDDPRTGEKFEKFTGTHLDVTFKCLSEIAGIDIKPPDDETSPDGQQPA